MPYIKADSRHLIRTNQVRPETPGELNYKITTVILQYLEDQGSIDYQRLNDVIGALESCKLEFYRRLIVNYENGKIASNGDVYN